jgi:hypothetical protein
MFEVKLLAALSFLPIIITAIVLYGERRRIFIYAPKFRLNYSFANWSIIDSYCTSIWIGTFSFIMLAAVQKFLLTNVSIFSLCAGPIFLTITGTVALLIEHYKLKDTYENHSKAIKTILVVSAVFIGYKSNAMTDDVIAEYTLVNASNFPDAQKIIAICVTVGIWAYTAVVFSLAIYILISMITFTKMITIDKINAKENRYRRCLIGNRPITPNTKNKEMLIFASLLVGAAMTVSAPLGFVEHIKTKEIEKIVKNLIVETSFHLPPGICNVEPADGSRLSLLPFRQAAIAIPDKNSTYNFAIIECNRTFAQLPKTFTDESTQQKK